MDIVNDCALPAWIWHRERHEKRSLTLTATVRADRPIEGAAFRMALTGGAVVRWNGETVARVAESPAATAAFVDVEGFPATIPAGEHALAIEIEVREIYPIADVNAYLHERRVGFIGYVEGDGLWLPSGTNWLADGENAAVVALLGEEPFGDLAASPAWFVRGGFGDIVAAPLADPVLLERSGLAASPAEDGAWRIRGTLAGTGGPPLEEPRAERLELFYHLRKQNEWKLRREAQLRLNLAALPQATVDLGREYNARLRVVNEAEAELTVLWNGAESLQELARYDGCITEWFRAAPGETRLTLPQGMRYVRLYFLGAENAAFAAEVRFEAVQVALEQTGSFASDVTRLPLIYDVSAHTSRICHQIGLWDGIKRDRLNWTFDLYMAARSCYFLWDDTAVIRRALRELGEGTPRGKWMNGICEYTLWWLQAVAEYVFYTGDRMFALELREPLLRHAGWVYEHADPLTGRLAPEGSILIEWVPLTPAEREAGLQAIYGMTLGALERLSSDMPELGLGRLPARPRTDESEYMREDNRLAIKALGMLAGLVSETRARAFLAVYELKDPVTPLSAYQLAECCSRYGMHDRAYGIIERVWGGMLDRGATTFWESYTDAYAGDDYHDVLTTYEAYGSYRISLCHSWSSTPVKWIAETVLGLECLSPGFAAVRFKPTAVGGIASCSGTVHTPRGPIAVSWRKDEGGELTGTIRAPEGIEVVVDGIAAVVS
ncbi:alpha-L-rhamnosidase C-terminal domain-containing protein [Cohnella nanjingensis]|uniref:Alpha-L-rhamnosidase n=1 Tax=Cohnella nanjingensis TaxID=1387779 RepID=A0A7X0RR12_9BACL|nr:alpha-L-rhamnosidase C-terminal domain-containing protein [Cohnella nanjingensis]MBB6671893.1 alpha-L-rhamnosidase [Cohnella nanjingensis]